MHLREEWMKWFRHWEGVEGLINCIFVADEGSVITAKRIDCNHNLV